MIEALPIKSCEEPLYIKGNKYFVVGTGTDDDGNCIDKLKSERTGKVKKFRRELVLKSLDKPEQNVEFQPEVKPTHPNLFK